MVGVLRTFYLGQHSLAVQISLRVHATGFHLHSEHSCYHGSQKWRKASKAMAPQQQKQYIKEVKGRYAAFWGATGVAARMLLHARFLVVLCALLLGANR